MSQPSEKKQQQEPLQQQQQTTMKQRSKYCLKYFNRTGKVELCRLLFAVANVEYDDSSIENLTDADNESGFLPYLQFDGTKIPFIPTICRFLAKEFDIAGTDPIQMAKIDAVAQACMSLIDEYYNNVFNVEEVDEKEIAMKSFMSEDVGNCAILVEKLINWFSDDPSKGFSVGNKLSYADLFVYEMARHYFPKEESFISRYPNIYTIKDNIENNNLIKEFNKQYVREHPSKMSRKAWKAEHQHKEKTELKGQSQQQEEKQIPTETVGQQTPTSKLEEMDQSEQQRIQKEVQREE